jgi:hypothetical protein
MNPPSLQARVEQVRFTRPASGKALGCLAYVLAIPVLCVFVGLGVMTLVFHGFAALGASETLSGILALVFGLAALVAIVAWGFRSWRRETAAEIVIDADRLTFSRGNILRTLLFDDVEVIRIRELIYLGQTLHATTRGGGRFRIPTDLIPVEELMKALVPTLVAHQVRRMESRLNSGEKIDLRQSGTRSVFLLVQALFAALLAIGTVLHVVRAVRLLLHATRLARLALRGWKGGVRISSDELRAADGTAPNMAWERVTCREDANGFVLEDRSGRRLALPMTADNYLPGVVLIDRLRSEARNP